MSTDPLKMAATALGPLLEEVVFLGGASIQLWLSDAAAPAARVTDDVNVISNITSLIRAATPPGIIATKLVAWHGRGNNDMLRSLDLHDIFVLVDGRVELPDEIAAQTLDLQNYVAQEFATTSTATSSRSGRQDPNSSHPFTNAPTSDTVH